MVAHKVIPRIFFGHPHKFIQFNIDKPGKLHELWDQVGNDIGKDVESSLGLKVVDIRSSGINGVLIKFPETSNMTECVMSVCVIQTKRILWFIPVDRPRYITLEYGLDDNNNPRGVLCEWSKDGCHINYGDAEIQDSAIFVASVKKLLSGSLLPETIMQMRG